MEERAKVIEGYVLRIRYRNENNGYTVLVLDTRYGEWTCVGTFAMVSEGQYLEVTGIEQDNPTYQETQFKVFSYVEKRPEDLLGMERYLGSGVIKGVGEALAKRIVKKFKLDTFRIIEEEPERLAEVKGISEKKAESIAIQFVELKEVRDAMVFLAGYNIPSHYAVKIYEMYGDEMYNILRDNPYRLAEDVSGIGFRVADEIAKKVGIPADSEFRIAAGMQYAMTMAGGLGYTYLLKDMLIKQAAGYLNTSLQDDILPDILDKLVMDGKLIAKRNDDELRVYTPLMYYSELKVAKMVLELDDVYDENSAPEISDDTISKIENGLGVKLDELQKDAIIEPSRHGVTIVTGGPGTGKTTVINGIIRYFEMQGMELLLAAPTGRAAKRMKEATGYEAMTIHRLLEISGDPSSDMHFKFERNHDNPLEADVVIIDEVSMVDILLMNSLLDAIASGTRLILVGDVNQLPSVGPGNVLKDLISSGVFATVRLMHIYRQDEDSRIVTNAHMINAGEQIPFDNKSKDFFFISRRNPAEIAEEVVSLVKERMPNYVGVTSNEIQVLTPMKKGDVGSIILNSLLQKSVNPPSKDKHEKDSGKFTFREGDKVMQIRNNYKLEWVLEDETGYEIDKGTGVFNGDVGVITHISDYAEEVTVEFDEGHKVIYPFSFLDELTLAYAVTVHKSQGSEYPVVVIPLVQGPPVLYTRNLLYTAVTRAKKCVVIVGDVNAVATMINNNNEQKRYSGLKDAILTTRI